MVSIALGETPAAIADATADYVERWFIPFTTLVRRADASPAAVRALLDAGAAPGTVYSRAPSGVWWSALGSRSGSFAPQPPREGAHWYSPAALYWLRHGLLTVRGGGTPAQAAAANRDRFTQQFRIALTSEPLAEPAFPKAFTAGEVDPIAAASIADGEWDSWRYGGYAVCLRSFTGSTCVQKEALAHVLKFQRTNSVDELRDDTLLDLIERLDALMLPFAPFQRPKGTPGLAVDRLLAALGLGADEPYPLT